MIRKIHNRRGTRERDPLFRARTTPLQWALQFHPRGLAAVSRSFPTSQPLDVRAERVYGT